MSQGGEVSTQQLVYGPDGKVYGNPALARAAGVNQTYREDGTPYPETMLGNLPLSPSVPITEAFDPSAGIGEFERRQFLPNQPVPVPSQYQQVMGQTGGATPYQRIMARMTPTMNPYGSVSGGYDPSFQGGYDPGLYSRLTRSGLINTGGGGMGGGGGGGDNPQPLSQQTIDFFNNETKEQRDDRMGRVNSVLQGIVNFAVPGVGLINALPSFLSSAALGRVNNALNPLGLINYDIPVEDAIPSYTQAYQAAQSYGGASMAEQQAMNDALAEAAIGSYGGGSFAEQQAMNDAISQSISDQSGAGASDAGTGYGTGDSSGGFGEGQYNMGGLVNRLGGPNPPGPDDGAGYLQRGEYVIKKSAVNKYGKGLLDMINDGKIPAKKMKSLLG